MRSANVMPNKAVFAPASSIFFHTVERFEKIQRVSRELWRKKNRSRCSSNLDFGPRMPFCPLFRQKIRFRESGVRCQIFASIRAFRGCPSKITLIHTSLRPSLHFCRNFHRRKQRKRSAKSHILRLRQSHVTAGISRRSLFKPYNPADSPPPCHVPPSPHADKFPSW